MQIAWILEAQHYDNLDMSRLLDKLLRINDAMGVVVGWKVSSSPLEWVSNKFYPNKGDISDSWIVWSLRPV